MNRMQWNEGKKVERPKPVKYKYPVAGSIWKYKRITYGGYEHYLRIDPRRVRVLDQNICVSEMPFHNRNTPKHCIETIRKWDYSLGSRGRARKTYNLEVFLRNWTKIADE